MVQVLEPTIPTKLALLVPKIESFLVVQVSKVKCVFFHFRGAEKFRACENTHGYRRFCVLAEKKVKNASCEIERSIEVHFVEFLTILESQSGVHFRLLFAIRESHFSHFPVLTGQEITGSVRILGRPGASSRFLLAKAAPGDGRGALTETLAIRARGAPDRFRWRNRRRSAPGWGALGLLVAHRLDPLHHLRMARPFEALLLRLAEKLRMNVRAALASFFRRFDHERVRLGKGVLANAGNLPGDFHSGRAAGNLELVVGDFLSDVEVRPRRADRSQ